MATGQFQGWVIAAQDGLEISVLVIGGDPPVPDFKIVLQNRSAATIHCDRWRNGLPLRFSLFDSLGEEAPRNKEWASRDSFLGFGGPSYILPGMTIVMPYRLDHIFEQWLDWKRLKVSWEPRMGKDGRAHPASFSGTFGSADFPDYEADLKTAGPPMVRAQLRAISGADKALADDLLAGLHSGSRAELGSRLERVVQAGGWKLAARLLQADEIWARQAAAEALHGTTGAEVARLLVSYYDSIPEPDPTARGPRPEHHRRSLVIAEESLAKATGLQFDPAWTRAQKRAAVAEWLAQ